MSKKTLVTFDFRLLFREETPPFGEDNYRDAEQVFAKFPQFSSAHTSLSVTAFSKFRAARHLAHKNTANLAK